MGNLALFVYCLALSLPSAAWRAYVAIVLWGWFVTPTFDLRAPDLWVMAGLMLFLLFGPSGVDPEKKEPMARALEITAKSVLLPAFALLFGWIFHNLAA